MQNFINKLDKINFNAYNDGKLTSLDGWGVSYSVRLSETHGLTDSVFQVVVRLTYNDALVTHYGCVSSEETNQFGLWFIVKKSDVTNAEYKERRENELNGLALYNLL